MTSPRRLEVNSPEALRALDPSDLPAVCQGLRDELVEVCARTGGHLGASLGAVELIVALHRVFRSPRDKLVFDVGHQAYAHKLLTGRRALMSTLRQAGGLAPFLSPRESVHDAFGAGHASTALSVGLGLALGRPETPGAERVVVVVGDGALTGGMAFEALNQAGACELPLIVVLNDNGMSISPNVGGLAAALRRDAGRTFFESLGLTYLGPVDGHDVHALIDALTVARRSRRPIVVHARTTKGKGFAPAEADEETKGHAVGPYELRDGKLVRSRDGRRTFSDVLARELLERMGADPRVVVVSPAMLEGQGLMPVKRAFPARVFDVGIAEQHAVALSAGMAAAGARPVCCIYSTFLQRAYDQLIHDVALPGLPVVFAVDRAGLVGADGATHQGAFDLAFMRPVPGLRIAAPMAEEDVGPLLSTALASAGPTALRFPRGLARALPDGLAATPDDGARWLHRPARPVATVVSIGPLGFMALEAARLRPEVAVLDVRWLSPLPEAALLEAARLGPLVVVEEGTTRGGLGGAVLEALAAHGEDRRVRLLGLPHAFVPHGEAQAQRAALKLSSQGVLEAVAALCEGGLVAGEGRE